MLVRAIEVVGVLFAAFGGFLVGIAPPPEADARFAVGISSFFALVILLLVASLSNRKYRKIWIIVAFCSLVLAAVTAYYYKSSYNELTFEYPPGNPKVEYVAGTELTPAAQKVKRDNEGISNAKLVAGFGGLPYRGKVWPDASVNAARRKLIFSYVILVTALALSIFALTEGTLGSKSIGSGKTKNSTTRKAKKRKRKTPAHNAATAESVEPGDTLAANSPSKGKISSASNTI